MDKFFKKYIKKLKKYFSFNDEYVDEILDYIPENKLIRLENLSEIGDLYSSYIFKVNNFYGNNLKAVKECHNTAVDIKIDFILNNFSKIFINGYGYVLRLQKIGITQYKKIRIEDYFSLSVKLRENKLRYNLITNNLNNAKNNR